VSEQQISQSEFNVTINTKLVNSKMSLHRQFIALVLKIKLSTTSRKYTIKTQNKNTDANKMTIIF